MSLPYKILAPFYNDLIKGESYDAWINNVIKTVKKYSPLNTGIDCACGSGTVTRKLKNAGYDVIGVDVSEEMLKTAQENSIKEGYNINFIKQDMKSLKSLEKVGFITAINDGFNYIMPSDVKKTLLSFNKCLVKGGLLVFDVSTEYKMQSVLDGQMYGDNDFDVSYMWFSEYNKNEKQLSISLTFFKKEGKLYRRYDEDQIQYCHGVNDISLALEESGFKIIDITDETFSEFKPNSTRAVFTAIKK